MKVLGVLLLSSMVARAEPVAVSVGIEGRLEVSLPGPELQAKPLDRAAPVALRIASAQARADGFRYDLRYVGYEPGTHDLRSWLVAPDGSPGADLPPLPVQIASVLPADHGGALVPRDTEPARLFGSYKWIIAGLAGLWVVVGFPLLRRRRQVVEQGAPPPAEPSLAERLRPLVAQAAAGSLSTDGKAQLERLLLGHWQQRLGLEGLDTAEAIPRLRAHAEAGQLLRTLEDWLHRPPGSATFDLTSALAPYGHQGSPKTFPA